MDNSKIILVERCGPLGRIMQYMKDEEHNKVMRVNPNENFVKSISQTVQDLFREVFLPYGYPDSVSKDYFDYQIWDTLQAFCSTITGTFTTQAVLKGMGVGDFNATPFAAAITWIMKDGTGTIGRIVFAWWKGNSLDANCKKWRLCADILNDFAMFLELLIPYISEFSLQVLCLTTTMKAIVGVAGGATRASITQHQAIQGNMADVSAKDGSQETCVNLVASVVGAVLLTLTSESSFEWIIFGFFAFIHLFANYLALCALVFTHLNISRLVIVLRTYLRFDTVPNPLKVNQKESVLIGIGPKEKEICGFDIKMGEPLTCITSSMTLFELNNLSKIYENSNYFPVVNMKHKIIYVALEKGEKSQDVIAAYFYAVLLGVATCYYNQMPVSVYTKRQLHHVTSIMRLYSVLKPFPKNATEKHQSLPFEVLRAFNEFVKQEMSMFFIALKVNGWTLDEHSIEIGKWRAEWKFTNDYEQTHYSPSFNKED